MGTPGTGDMRMIHFPCNVKSCGSCCRLALQMNAWVLENSNHEGVVPALNEPKLLYFRVPRSISMCSEVFTEEK